MDKASARIVAHTNVELGKMFLTLFDDQTTELTVFVFRCDGKGEIVETFDAKKKSIRDKIRNDRINLKLDALIE